MEQTLSNSIQSKWTLVFKALFKSLSFVLVIAMLVSITSTKLSRMNEEYIADNSMSTMTVKEKLVQLDCLTRNIYHEAGNEPFEGKVAVAQVTMNRVNSGKFASDICGVVHQKNIFYQKVVCQFSWYCTGTDQRKIIHNKLYAESEEVAKKVFMENFRLPGMKDALYYHADYVNPNWGKPRVGQIGRHIFYKDPI